MVLTLDAVVMEMERSSASASGTVTMEIPIAAAASVEPADPEESVQQHGQDRAGAAVQHRNYRILIVIGEISTGHHLDAARKQIAQGLRSWNVDLTVCDLNKELQLFETRHTAQFSAEVKENRCCLSEKLLTTATGHGNQTFHKHIILQILKDHVTLTSRREEGAAGRQLPVA